MKPLLLAGFLCILLPSWGQITLKGVVRAQASKEALIGVSILLDGSEAGASSDLDGNFAIEVPALPARLRFSYIGMKEQLLTVAVNAPLEVFLEEDASLLEEVVVVGYGTQLRSNISGSVASVSSADLEGVPILRTEQALQGRTAGVQVAQNSGSPGSTLTVRIRGTGTINNSAPLYLVDGMPVEGIDFLNPSDIASINILKDAASSAIYGARGANGVVLITTKSGKKNQDGQISIESSYGVQNTWRRMSLLNAEEYAALSNEAHIAAGKAPRPEFADPKALGKGTDWQEAIFSPAPMASHQLNFLGGTEKGSYSLSGSYLNQEGIVGRQKSGFERYTTRLKLQQQVKTWLALDANLAYTQLTRNGLPENNVFNTPLARALNIDPVTPVRRFDGSYAYSAYSDTDIANPVAAIERQSDTWSSTRIVGGVGAQLTLAPGLSIRSAYNLDRTFAHQDLFYPKFDLSLDPTLADAPAAERSLVNTVVKNDFTWSNWQWESVLQYDKNWKEKKLALTLGHTALENTFYVLSGANTNLPSNNPADAYIGNTIDPRESQSAGDNASESALLSFFGRAQFDWKDRYLFSASFRRDGSSRFGTNNRFGHFPSASAAWILSREAFWGKHWLSFAKIRVSWGQNGNDKIGDYSYSTVVLPGQNYTFGPSERITNGSAPQQASNPDLRWETSEQANLGLDLEAWNGKVNFSADYYRKYTRDMLSRVPIPTIVGVGAPFQNVGTMLNEGIELSLELQEKRADWSYRLSGNLSLTRTEVISLGEGGEPISAGNVFSAGNVSRTEVGHPVASFYGYLSDGIFQSVEEIKAHAFQSERTTPGDIRFKDLNADGKIDEADRTFIGNPTPWLSGGFSGSLGWKGFDLDMFWQGVYGNAIYNGIFRYDFFYANRPRTALGRWTGPGTSDSEPKVNLNDPNQNARVSDRFVEDGSYLRLKNLQLGYSLPANLLRTLHLQRFRAYLSAQNLLTFTRYSGLDPEIGTVGGALEIGIDYGFYPQSRILGGGVQITF